MRIIMPVQIIFIAVFQKLFSRINHPDSRITQTVHHLLRPGQFSPFGDVVRKIVRINIFFIGRNQDNEFDSPLLKILPGGQAVVPDQIQFLLGIKIGSLIIFYALFIRIEQPVILSEHHAVRRGISEKLHAQNAVQLDELTAEGYMVVIEAVKQSRENLQAVRKPPQAVKGQRWHFSELSVLRIFRIQIGAGEKIYHPGTKQHECKTDQPCRRFSFCHPDLRSFRFKPFPPQTLSLHQKFIYRNAL